MKKFSYLTNRKPATRLADVFKDHRIEAGVANA